MSLPPSNSQVWMLLANGGLSKLHTNHLGTQMLIKRLELSPVSATEKSREIHAYFAKWERCLADEVAQIARF